MEAPIVGQTEVSVLKFEMLRRSMNPEDLARPCSISVEDFTNQMRLGFPRRLLRWRIEKALGHMCIWTDPITMSLRVRCFKAFGADPFTCSKKEILPILRHYKICATGNALLDELRDNLIGWLAVHPEITKNEKK